jgi:hypothetical protein
MMIGSTFYEILQRLCQRFPSANPVPEFHLILAPWFHTEQDIIKKWHHDRIVLSLGRNACVRTPQGDVRVSSDYLQSAPIINFEGFLIPPSAAPLFATDEHRRNWPVLTCKKVVLIKF